MKVTEIKLKAVRASGYLTPASVVFALLGALITPSMAQDSGAQSSDQLAASTPQTLSERYPAGSILSVDAADQAKAAVEQRRLQVESHFAAKQQECYERFFATRCIDAAQEERRLALKEARAIEVEANAFKRRHRAEQRDAAIAGRREQDERRQAEPAPDSDAADKSASEGVSANEARRLEQRAEQAAKAAAAAPALPADAGTQSDAEQAEREATDVKEAAKRARNEEKFLKKQRDSAQRQRTIATRKAEKARKQAEQPERTGGEDASKPVESAR